MSKPFHYSLEALLRKRNWDLQALSLEVQQALVYKEHQQRICEDMRLKILGGEDALREHHAMNMEIQPEQYNALLMFISDLRDALVVAEGRLREAADKHSELFDKLVVSKQSIKSLERHKELRRLDHRVEEQREEIRDSDELWLLRAGARDI